ncbi:taste receptor type 2 member 40-like [Ambystoma mexicanum]|uniref:taste receptor type 2 member 40-like n=1 Tax=Ambystoma mexicanum TaxID=8296 RepID=UPI0037E937BA
MPFNFCLISEGSVEVELSTRSPVDRKILVGSGVQCCGGEMMTLAYAILVSLHVISLVTGLMGNVFILTVNFIERLRSNSDFGSSELILCSLAFSNIGHVCVFFVLQTSPMLFQALYLLDRAVNGFIVTLLWLRCCSVWFATSFCIYCCVKIVSFTHPFLARLAKIFMNNVSWLLLVSVFVSLATCIPIAFDSDLQPAVQGLNDISIDKNLNTSLNGSTTGPSLFKSFKKEYTGYVINLLLGFAVFIFSTLAILITLFRHMKRMGQHAQNFRNPSLDAHTGAVKTVASLLALYSTFCIMNCIRSFHDFAPSSSLYLACLLMFSYFPALNSLILILRISKLKKTLVRILLCAARYRMGTA